MSRTINLFVLAVTSVVLAACLMGCGAATSPVNDPAAGKVELAIVPSYWSETKEMWLFATKVDDDHFTGPAGSWDFGMIRADSSVHAVKPAGGHIEPSWDIRNAIGGEAPIEGKSYHLDPGDWTVTATGGGVRQNGDIPHHPLAFGGQEPFADTALFVESGVGEQRVYNQKIVGFLLAEVEHKSDTLKHPGRDRCDLVA